MFAHVEINYLSPMLCGLDKDSNEIQVSVWVAQVGNHHNCLLVSGPAVSMVFNHTLVSSIVQVPVQY